MTNFLIAFDFKNFLTFLRDSKTSNPEMFIALVPGNPIAILSFIYRFLRVEEEAKEYLPSPFLKNLLLKGKLLYYPGNTEQGMCQLTNEYPFFLFLIGHWYYELYDL